MSSTIQGAQRAFSDEQLIRLRICLDMAAAAVGPREGTKAVEDELEARFKVSIATLGRAALGLPVKEASARLIEAALERDK